MRKGVEASRLKPRAFSNHRPLVAVSEGRREERSRRVELYLVQGDSFQFPPERPEVVDLSVFGLGGHGAAEPEDIDAVLAESDDEEEGDDDVDDDDNEDEEEEEEEDGNDDDYNAEFAAGHF